jgi:hypothetical protein
MARTYRKGWKAVTGSDTDNRGIAHHATNDWFSKKNVCRGSDDRDEYWGRDKRGVKQLTRRKQRRVLNTLVNEEFLYED